ncbi:hypothetical protein, partial [Bacteroides ovatus]|uniref:hypothetical protein n=1 Tax=Bacteroides ovatus TaxID=28116 RepID=UPI00233E5E11
FRIPFFIVCSFNFNVNNLCDTFYAKLRLVFERFVWKNRDECMCLFLIGNQTEAVRTGNEKK